MMTLYTRLHRKLIPKPVDEFDEEYLKKHSMVDHNIPELSKNHTLIDVIAFVFEKNPEIIADFLQSYLNGGKEARELMDLMEETVEDGDGCLICLRRGIKDYLSIPSLDKK